MDHRHNKDRMDQKQTTSVIKYVSSKSSNNEQHQSTSSKQDHANDPTITIQKTPTEDNQFNQNHLEEPNNYTIYIHDSDEEINPINKIIRITSDSEEELNTTYDVIQITDSDDDGSISMTKNLATINNNEPFIKTIVKYQPKEKNTTTTKYDLNENNKNQNIDKKTDKILMMNEDGKITDAELDNLMDKIEKGSNTTKRTQKEELYKGTKKLKLNKNMSPIDLEQHLYPTTSKEAINLINNTTKETINPINKTNTLKGKEKNTTCNQDITKNTINTVKQTTNKHSKVKKVQIAAVPNTLKEMNNPQSNPTNPQSNPTTPTTPKSNTNTNNSTEINQHTSNNITRHTIKEEIIGGLKDMTTLNLQIPQRVKNILSVGPKFITPYRTSSVEDITQMIQDITFNWEINTDMEKLKNFEQWKCELIKELIKLETGTKVNNKGTRFDIKEREIIEDIAYLETFLRCNPNITITEADKGKFTIIVEKEKFEKLKDIFMQKAEINGLYKLRQNLIPYTSRVNTEATATKEKRIQDILAIEKIKLERIKKEEERTKESFKNKCNQWKQQGIYRERSKNNIEAEEKYWEALKDIKAEIPQMKFVLKGHKETMSIRNITPKNQSITYKLGQILNELIAIVTEKNLRRIGKTEDNMNINIKDISKFAIDIRKHTIEEEHEMITADVEEMFNAINTEQLKIIIRSNIDEEKYNSNTIMDMINFDLTGASMVLYKNNILNQEQGIPMGGTSSSTYADFYTNYFIYTTWDKMIHKGLIKLNKYVDDIFIISKKDTGLTILHELGKEMKLNIKPEMEKDKTVNFLQMQIIRDGNSITTRSYKKPYVSNRFIHADSAHPEHIKNETIMNLFMNTLNLTDTKYVYDSLQINISQLKNNGYTYKTIIAKLNCIKRKYKHKMKDTLSEKEIDNKLIVIEDCIYTLNMKIDSEKRKLVNEKRNKINKRSNTKNTNNHEGNKRNKIDRIKDRLKNVGISKRKITKRIKYKQNNNLKSANMKYIRIPYNIRTIDFLKKKINEPNKDKKQPITTILSRKTSMKSITGKITKE